MHWVKKITITFMLITVATLTTTTANAGIISGLAKLFREMGESAADVGRVVDDIPTPVREVPSSKPSPLSGGDDIPAGTSASDELSRLLDDMEDPVRASAGEDTVVRKPMQLALDLGRNVDTFATAAREPDLLVAMPTNAHQYRTIYKAQNVSAGAEQQLKQFQQQLSQLEGVAKFDGGLDDLFAQLDNADGSPVVVFAHSEEGGKRLVLANGDTVQDVEIHKHCADRGKVCVVLTCHGDDFAITGKLAARDALAMWQHARGALKSRAANNQTLTNEEYIFAMRSRKNQIDVQNKGKVFISFSGSVGAIAFYYSSEEPSQ